MMYLISFCAEGYDDATQIMLHNNVGDGGERARLKKWVVSRWVGKTEREASL